MAAVDVQGDIGYAMEDGSGREAIKAVAYLCHGRSSAPRQIADRESKVEQQHIECIKAVHIASSVNIRVYVICNTIFIGQNERTSSVRVQGGWTLRWSRCRDLSNPHAQIKVMQEAVARTYSTFINVY
eukprot:1192043-Prorocentrum_minimum.AAC.4